MNYISQNYNILHVHNKSKTKLFLKNRDNRGKKYE